MYRRRKYGNIKVRFQGKIFDSILERNRYVVLLNKQRSGVISDLKHHVTIALSAYGVHICKYIADFTYMMDGRLIVEDVKSNPTMTPEFKLKKKLFEAQTGQELFIVKNKTLHSMPGNVT